MKTIAKQSSDIILNEETFNDITLLITELIKSKEWEVKGDISNLVEEFSNNSTSSNTLSKTKKLKKRIFFLQRVITLKRINNLFSEFNIKATVDYSTKEQKIRSTRKDWVEARNKASEAIVLYKATKGDFYK